MTSFSFLFKVNMSSIDCVMEKVGNMKGHMLCEFYDPLPIKNFGTEITGHYGSAYNLSERVQELLPMMHRCQKSSVFLRIWEGECNRETENCTSIDDVPAIWKPVFDQ